MSKLLLMFFTVILFFSHVGLAGGYDQDDDIDPHIYFLVEECQRLYNNETYPPLTDAEREGLDSFFEDFDYVNPEFEQDAIIDDFDNDSNCVRPG